MHYILASASPRRRELLKQLIPEFEVIPSTCQEVIDRTLCPNEIVESLATQKCADVFSAHPDAVVIGSDTVVVFRGEILGKPSSKEDALRTLTALSGQDHEVITGVCIMAGNQKIIASDTTAVHFNDLSQAFIRAYVESGSPMDKAGSYGIQDEGVVASYTGSYSNVMGLPVELLQKLLKEVSNDKTCD